MMYLSILAIVLGFKLLAWGLERADENAHSRAERRLRRQMRRDLDASYMNQWKRASYEEKRRLYEQRCNNRDRW